MKSTIVLGLMACASAFAQTDGSTQPPSILKSEGGRYVFGQVGPARSDQFLLDTKTGRLWSLVVDKQGVWKLQAVPFIGILHGDEPYIPESDEEAIQHREFVRQIAARQMQEAIEKAAKQRESESVDQK